MTSFTIPNVGTLTSSALTAEAMQIIFQALMLQALGVSVDPNNQVDPGYSLVRIDFPPPGQPAFDRTEDVAFVRCISRPGSYGAHETAMSVDSNETFLQTTSYSRSWTVTMDFWGPNASARSRQVWSCLFMDFLRGTLAASNLYPLPTLAEPTRAPDLFANQWWERYVLSFELYEQVTETIALPSMASVQVLIQDATGLIANDQTVDLDPPPVYGGGAYSLGPYGSQES
jgi:hypothetical protein